MCSTYIYKIYDHNRNWRLNRQINVGVDIHNHFIRLHKSYYKQYKQNPRNSRRNELSRKPEVLIRNLSADSYRANSKARTWALEKSYVHF